VHFLKWKCEEHVSRQQRCARLSGSSRVHELNPRFWISETRLRQCSRINCSLVFTNPICYQVFLNSDVSVVFNKQYIISAQHLELLVKMQRLPFTDHD
jgi:hypothetical protein